MAKSEMVFASLKFYNYQNGEWRAIVNRAAVSLTTLASHMRQSLRYSVKVINGEFGERELWIKTGRNRGFLESDLAYLNIAVYFVSEHFNGEPELDK